MPKPCSLELRERVVEAVESGASRRSAVWRFFERHNISFKKTISDSVRLWA